MKKRFIFIMFSIESGYYDEINFGVAYLAPILKKHSYEVAFLSISHEITGQEFLDKIEHFNPSIVGFSCTTHQLQYLPKYSKELEKYPEILQIAGGVGPTLDPEWVLHRSGVKGVCIGEGEVPLDSLLDAIDNARDILDSKGFFWYINGSIKKNYIPPFISDLSTLDFPDYTIFGRKEIDTYESLSIILSRGCPLNCYYCCNTALAKRYPDSNKYFRLPSVEHSISLIERLIRQYPKTKFIIFQDDLLIADKIWFASFAEEYRRRIGISYRVCTRPEYIDSDTIAALKLSGCRWIYMGLESGSEYVRAELLNRKYTNRLFIEKSRLIKDSGIYLYTFNIVGFPFETKEQLRETFRLNKRISPHAGVCTFFYPYKHTVLYKICQENNLLKSEEEMLQITNYNNRPAIKMHFTQERDCVYFQKKINCYFAGQRRWTLIANLPFGIKKCYIIIYEYINSFFSLMPFVHNILRNVLRLLGFRKPQILNF